MASTQAEVQALVAPSSSANLAPAAAAAAVPEQEAAVEGTVVERCPARIGLMGNPSDGFNGKTLSILVANFGATVTLTPSATLVRGV